MRTPIWMPLMLVLACGSTHRAPPSVPSIPMPSGAQLLPYSSAAPGMARPTGMALVGGRVYVALGNYDSAYVVRGPGLLGVLDPQTGKTDVIDIGGSGGTQCQEPYQVRDSGGKLYATCSGYTDFSVDPKGNVDVIKTDIKLFVCPSAPDGRKQLGNTPDLGVTDYSPTTSITLSGRSLEKLKASPARVRSAAIFSATNVYAAAPSST